MFGLDHWSLLNGSWQECAFGDYRGPTSGLSHCWQIMHHGPSILVIWAGPLVGVCRMVYAAADPTLGLEMSKHPKIAKGSWVSRKIWPKILLVDSICFLFYSFKPLQKDGSHVSPIGHGNPREQGIGFLFSMAISEDWRIISQCSQRHLQRWLCKSFIYSINIYKTV